MWAIFGYIDTIDAPIHSSKIKRRIKKVEEEEEEIGKDTHKERKKERGNYIQSAREQINYDIVFRGAGRIRQQHARRNSTTLHTELLMYIIYINRTSMYNAAAVSHTRTRTNSR